jgi:hypothetical protein
MLIVTLENEMILIARAMEQVTMDLQLTNTCFVGYGDQDDPYQTTMEVLKKEDLTQGRLGIEKKQLIFSNRHCRKNPRRIAKG